MNEFNPHEYADYRLEKDVFENILLNSDSPKKLGCYLTNQIREIIGCEAVLMYNKKRETLHTKFELLSITPERKLESIDKKSLSIIIKKCEFMNNIDVINIDFKVLDMPCDKIIIKSAIVVPLKVENKIVGMVILANPTELDKINPIVSVLRRLSKFIAQILLNTLMYHDQTKAIFEKDRVIEEREVLFEEVMKLLPVGLFLADRFNNITYINPYLEDITNINISELVGKNWETIFNISKNEIDNEIRYFEGNILIGEKKRIISGLVTKQINNEGKISRYIGAVRDITDQYTYEESLKESKESAEKANKAKSEFLSNMSHELRTPLNGIIGLAQIMLIEKKDEKMSGMLNKMLNSGYSLLDLINSILDLSKIEEGKLSLNIAEFDFKSIQEEIKVNFQNALIKKGIEFKIEILSDIPRYMVGDCVKIVQIINNLLSNAMKFTDSGSIIVVFEYIKEYGGFKIDVEDTGIGMKKEMLSRIFGRFEQGEYYLTKKYGGVGLGLSIVKGFVDLMKGDISIESDQNNGTKVSIVIPIEKSIKNNEFIKTTKSNDEFEKKTDSKILLVEDSEINQVFFKELASLKNWNLDVAETGNEAIDLYVKHEYKLILMDIQLPEMNGIEATKTIREMEINTGNHIPIIGVSAFAMEKEINTSLEAGMDEYIAKPIDIKSLIAAISKYL